MMTDTPATGGAISLLERLQDATNRHDLDALVDCFTVDYASDLPLHPSRSFRGRDQVRRNWSQILAGIPDLHSRLVRCSTSETTVWAEWEWTGTRLDGVPHLMRGVTILGVEGDRFDWARFYMEPVTDDGVGIDESVHRVVAPGASSGAES
jgi:ketosteroid isomerase-like protein